VITTKKLRGRPVGSVDPKVQEAKSLRAQAQILKLEARKARITDELLLIEEKISNHSVTLKA